MDTLLTEELLLLRHRVLDFAADQRFFSEDLSASMSFPHEIWEEMGRQGFHGIGIPREHG